MDTDTIEQKEKRRGDQPKTPYIVFEDAPPSVPGFTTLGEAVGRLLGRLLFERVRD